MAAKEFRLCSTCSERQNTETAFTIVEPRLCFICRGLTLKVTVMEHRILRLVRRYQFWTFSVGMVIPADVQEREDQLRSDLQIRGMETFKSQTARRISEFVRRKTRKKVDRGRPDITILVDLDEDTASVTAKSFFAHARYTKPKGVSQRREFCDECSGRGCDVCKDGYSNNPSIEESVGRRLCRITRSPKARFTWIGSEDAESIVYPPGRPFVVEMKDPKRRELPHRFGVVTGRGRVVISSARVLRERPEDGHSFTFRTRAFVEPQGPLDGVRLGDAKKIVGSTIQHRNSKGKTVYKKVYSVRVRKLRKELEAEMKLDGGLPVKRLVSGESVSPSLSEVLGVPLLCRSFDILEVREFSPRNLGTRRRR